MFWPTQYSLYSTVYMSIPISQFIFPPPHSLVTVCLLYLWLCFCSVTKFIYTLFLHSTYKWYHMIFVFLCLTSLSMKISRVHPCWCKWHYFVLFYGWVIFHVVAILNSAAMKKMVLNFYKVLMRKYLDL